VANIIKVLGGGSLLQQLARDVTTQLDRRFASFGITTTQASVLLYVCAGEASPGQLTAAVGGTDTAGMTKLLDRLEAKELVTRRPNRSDRRSVVVEATERGLALVPDLSPVFGEVAKQLFDGFTDDEIANFTSYLRRMGENLKS
jgi:DNA-binding MarR family transcriptional regulator